MLVVIDPQVTALAVLVAGVQPGAQVLVLDRDRDGLAQITQFLRHHTGFTSLHLVGHGQPGCLKLGKGAITLHTLDRAAADLATWQHAFDGNFEIQIYGCNSGQGAIGRAWVQKWHTLTGAGVAAARGAIGRTTAGQNWQLAVTAGDVAGHSAFTPALQASYAGQFATFVVGTVTDLQNAIVVANGNTEADEIQLNATTFDLSAAFLTDPNTGLTGLPAITDSFGITIRSDTPGVKRTIQRTGGADFRLFLVQDGASLTLEDVIISGGRVTDLAAPIGDDGGGILNLGGTVNITDSEINNNFAADDGGGIATIGTGGNAATVVIDNTTISGNTAAGDTGLDDGGGGVDADGNNRNSGMGSNLTIRNGSVITNNASTLGVGGGLRAWDGATVTIENSSITNNNAAAGGGLAAGSPTAQVTQLISVTNSSFTGNTNGDAVSVGTTAPNVGTVSGNTVDTGDLKPDLEGGIPVDPTVELIRVDTGAEVLDAGTVAITAGGATATLFRITNRGSTDLNLGVPTITNTTEFNIDTSGFTAILPFNTTTEFSITPITGGITTFPTTLTTGVEFTENDPNVADPFDFTFEATIVDDLAIDNPTTGSFIFGDTTTNGDALQITVQGSTQSTLETLKLTTNSGGQELLFDVLPDSFRPGGLLASSQNFLIAGMIASGEQFQVEVDGKTATTEITQLAIGRYSLQFDIDGDGLFTDLRVIIDQVATALPIGVGDDQANGREVIDLEGVSGSKSAVFTLYREAFFNNTVGLYQIDDINGAVNGVNPGESGYAQAAIENRVEGITLRVGNQQSATVSGVLEGGSLYAPFIIVDSTIDAFLEAEGGGQAYFIYTEANSDNQDHIVLLGNNLFGFEDLRGGGDLDFNDLIFQVEIT